MSFKELTRVVRGRMGSSVESFQSREHLYLMLLAAAIGLMGGLGNLFFQWLIDLIRDFSWGGSDHFVQRFQGAPLYLKLGVPTLAGLAGGLIIHFVAPEAKGHGVPEVMKAVALKDGVIPRRTVIGKTFASAEDVFLAYSAGVIGTQAPIQLRFSGSLIDLVAQRVSAEHGIDLELEIEIWDDAPRRAQGAQGLPNGEERSGDYGRA